MYILGKKRSEEAKTPFYYHGENEDAAMDLSSAEKKVLKPGERDLIFTNFSANIPEENVGLVVPRSGLAIKYGVTVLNAPGVIDPSYRGDIGVLLINHGNNTFEIEKGDRIAQLLVLKREKVKWIIVDNLDKSKRGESGFGDSGI